MYTRNKKKLKSVIHLNKLKILYEDDTVNAKWDLALYNLRSPKFSVVKSPQQCHLQP